MTCRRDAEGGTPVGDGVTAAGGCWPPITRLINRQTLRQLPLPHGAPDQAPGIKASDDPAREHCIFFIVEIGATIDKPAHGIIQGEWAYFHISMAWVR